MGQVERDVVVTGCISDGAVQVLVVVCVEPEVVTDRVEAIGPSVLIRVGDPSQLGLLGDHDFVAVIVFDEDAEAFISAFGKEAPLMVANPPDACGTGSYDDGSILRDGDAGGLEELVSSE